MKDKMQYKFKSKLTKGLLILLLGVICEVSWGQNIQGGTAPTLSATPTDLTFGNYGNASPWFMSWDNTYLYIGKTAGASGEAVIIYLDLDPTSPSNGGVSGGGNSAGNQTGTTDWSCTPTLPFNADIRIYATNNYLEYSSRNGSGGWNTAVNITSGNIGNDGTSNRTLRFQWTLGSVVSGLPSSFNWLGYQISNTSFIYDQIPSSNVSGTQNTPRLYFYQTVTNTNSTATTNPFSANQLSFETRVGFGYTSSFSGTIYDFTVNGGTSTLSTSLNVRNNFVVNSGDFRSSGSRNLTLSGVNGSGILQINNTNGASFTGTDAGSGNDISLIISTSGTITLSGNATSNNDHEKKFYNCTINNGATLALSRGLLIRYGLFTVNGTLQINSNGYVQSGVSSNVAATYSSSTGSLIYNNGGSYSITAFEWPTTNSPRYITIQNSGTNLTIGSSRTISATGSMTVNEGCGIAITSGTLTTNNNLTIKSTASGDGRIGESAGSISGNVNVERYIPGLSSKRYRFLSSPVATTVSDWRGEIFVTGGGVDGEFNSVGTGNIKTANGFDWTLSGASSFWSYNENQSGGLNSKWVAATNVSNSLTAGVGYRVFVRGDRSNAGVLDNSVASQSAVTISSTGTVNAGTITLPATYHGSSSDEGWNLVGNPYASTIDWNASSGWTKTGVSGTIWIYNPSTNSYGNWDGATTTNSVTRYISSGQGFFVRTTSSPTFSCTEAVKVSTAGAGIFKTGEENTLRISLTKDQNNKDETVIRFMEGRNNEFSEVDDVRKFYNPTVNVSSFFDTSNYAAVNYLKNELLSDKIVPLSAWVDAEGTYKLNFTGVENFNLTKNIFLKDKFLNTLTDLSLTPKIDFTITSNINSKGDNRFEVVFVAKSSNNTKEDLMTLSTTNLSVFPNPATDLLNVNLSNTNFKTSNIIIYNISGKEVSKTIMKGTTAQLNIDNLSNGVYFVKVSNENGFNQTVKFVK